MPELFVTGADLDSSSREKAISHVGNRVRTVLVPTADSSDCPNPWRRLPAGIAALVAPPGDWCAIVSSTAISVEDRHLGTALHAAVQNGEATIVMSLAARSSRMRLPELAPRELALSPAVRSAIAGIGASLGQPVKSTIDLTALQAGILQMADHLTPSHEHSQSIEGRGRRQAGDYWHAINHRREPDDGNAKYWFRHVGNHPLLSELSAVIPSLAAQFPEEVNSKGRALLERGRLDPFRFVDLASEARRRRDADLIRFCERLQWIEMLGLLDWTIRDTLS